MSADIPIVSLLLRIAVLIISVLAVGFFAGAETAFLAMDKWVISSLSTEGDKRARVLQGLKDNSENTLSALLVGTNVFTIPGISERIVNSVHPGFQQAYPCDSGFAPCHGCDFHIL